MKRSLLLFLVLFVIVAITFCGVIMSVILGDTPDEPCEHSFVNNVCTICGAVAPSTGLEYTLNDDGVSYGVSGIGTCTDTDIVISPTYEDLPVTSIGEMAFAECDSLTSITIPDSVTSIGDYAFLYCYSLTSIIVDTNNENYKSIDGNLYTKDGKTLIQYAFGKKDASFIIPDGVTSIGDYAFAACSSFTNITIPDSVTSIGDVAFAYCESLTSITIPSSVTIIGYNAFYGCSSLTSIIVDANNEYYKSIDGNLYTKDGKTLIQYAIGKTDTSFIIPDGVTSIGDGAFEDCDSLTSITIPDSVTSIGNCAFLSCDSLASITMPDSVTRIGDVAFASCSSLTSITIPDGVTNIGDVAFSSCSSLTSITIPDSVTSIGVRAFYGCSSLTGITIPDSVTSIGDEAFEYCYRLDTVYYTGTASEWIAISIGSNSYLTSATRYYYSETQPSEEGNFWHYVDGEIVIWPEYVAPAYSEGLEYTLNADGISYTVSGIGTCTDTDVVILYEYNGLPVTNISDAAFYGDDITSITIPDSVTSIGDYAFLYCYSLTSIIVDTNNDNYKSIDGNLYTKDGKTLIQYAIGKTDTSFIIPDGVTSLGWYVFANCDSLVSITIPDSVTIISYYTFYDCDSLTSITIPNSVTSIGDGAFYHCSRLTSITIPDSVTSIGDSAFSSCHSLTTVIFEKNSKLTSIDDSAFNSCSSLTSITIPDSVTNIGAYAFHYCKSLTNIIVDANNENYKSIDGNLYTKDSKTLIQYATGKKDTSFIIPDGVTSLGWYVFANCDSLTSINIPDSVTSIGDGAFYDCFRLTSITIPDSIASIGDKAFECCYRLDTVYYTGTASEWNAISIGGGNSELTSATRYYYSETEPTEIGNFWHYVDGEPVIWPEYVAPNYSEGLEYTLNDDGVSYSVTGIGTCTDKYVIIPATYNGLPVTSIGVRAFNNCSSLTSITIHDSVTSIGDAAFYYCYNLTTVMFGENSKLTSIGNYAFYNCSSLTSITIPSSVISIGDGAFTYCYSLTNITIPSSVTSIGDDTFWNCSNLTSITIPSSVTSIGDWVFAYCDRLTNITIPSSVTSIGDYAFEYCDSLETIYYTGTASEWNAISIDSYNSSLTSATRYYYSETQPTEEGNFWHYVDGEIVVW